ncbi:tyrosine recombinase XerC [Microbacterium sp. Marseille-Q6965]|uniref:site-specific integrase n=1 Tax=Microbacterium sp. Marseille-Q6965 TaxID=2965072 RepID=UPI0021B7A6CE|nr:tyrosine-type recombinase/integrase [Microbacterium sp. Marseille-Q6965]
MGRRPLGVGELGGVTYAHAGKGVVVARARTRDAGGVIHRPQARGATKEEALERLQAKARRLAVAGEEIGPDTPLGDLFQMWLEDREGEIRPQSHRFYKDIVRWLTPIVGGIPVGECRPARVKRILDEIEAARGSGAALDHARTALSGAFVVAVEEGALDHNPLLSLRKRKGRQQRPKALNVEQVRALRAAIRRREERAARYTGESVALLRIVSEVMLGSGLRIAEVLGLRHRDIDWETNTIEVTGTLIDEADTWHLVRQDELKGRNQARFIELPGFAMAALAEARRNASDLPSRHPDKPAIQGQATGRWVSARNVRRQLRDVRNDPELVAALAETGIEPDELKPHMLRRTAATLVATTSRDIKRAQALLGHQHESTTRRQYIGIAFKTVGDASMLQQLLGNNPWPDDGPGRSD